MVIAAALVIRRSKIRALLASVLKVAALTLADEAKQASQYMDDGAQFRRAFSSYIKNDSPEFKDYHLPLPISAFVGKKGMKTIINQIVNAFVKRDYTVTND